MPRISKAELIRLQKKLKTDAAIGGQFGITRQAVHTMRKVYGIPPRFPDYAGRNAEIIAFRKKGMLEPALAKKFHLSISQIFNIIRKVGVNKNKSAKKLPGKKTPAGRKKK